MLDQCKGKGFYGRNLEQEEPNYFSEVHVVRRILMKSFIVANNVLGKVYEVAFQGEDGKTNTVYTGELYGIGNKLWEIDVWDTADMAEKYLITYPWRTGKESKGEILKLFHDSSSRHSGFASVVREID
jgi:hypothetical protein